MNPERPDRPADHDPAGLDRGASGALTDLPLREGEPADAVPIASEYGTSGLAALPDRALGVAADAAVSVLIVLAALLSAFAAAGRTPRFAGLGWAAAFALYVSFFAVVVPLLFFGKTVGMALAGLVARDDGAGRRLTWRQAARRWLGTLATVAALGLPLFWTARDPAAPTPADRLSGRTLVRDV